MKNNKIAIHGVPRSGTTWLGEIFNSSPNVKYLYQPLFSYAHKAYLNENSTVEQINDFFNRLRFCTDSFTNQLDTRKDSKLPNFEKSQLNHIVYKEVRYHNIIEHLLNTDPELQVCLIIRNPLAVISSWLKAPREFRGDLGWKIDEEWRAAAKKNLGLAEEYHGYYKWKEAAFLFIKLKKMFSDRVYLLKYSDLVRDTEVSVSQLFDFFHIKLYEQTLGFIENSKNKSNEDAYSVYRTKSSDDNWKSGLPGEIINEVVDDLKGSPLEKYL